MLNKYTINLSDVSTFNSPKTKKTIKKTTKGVSRM